MKPLTYFCDNTEIQEIIDGQGEFLQGIHQDETYDIFETIVSIASPQNYNLRKDTRLAIIACLMQFEYTADE